MWNDSLIFILIITNFHQLTICTGCSNKSKTKATANTSNDGPTSPSSDDERLKAELSYVSSTSAKPQDAFESNCYEDFGVLKQTLSDLNAINVSKTLLEMRSEFNGHLNNIYWTLLVQVIFDAVVVYLFWRRNNDRPVQ